MYDIVSMLCELQLCNYLRVATVWDVGPGQINKYMYGILSSLCTTTACTKQRPSTVHTCTGEEYEVISG